MKKRFIALALSAAVLTGCGSLQNSLDRTNADLKRGDYQVTLYSGGKQVRQWHLTNSYVSSEDGSDGWYFFDQGKMVRLTGDVVVEQR